MFNKLKVWIVFMFFIYFVSPVYAFRMPTEAERVVPEGVRLLEEYQLPYNGDLLERQIFVGDLGVTQTIDENTVKALLQEYLLLDPDELLGDIVLEDLTHHYFGVLPATDHRPAMSYWQLNQNYNGRRIAKARIDFAVKHLPTADGEGYQNVLVLVDSVFVKPQVLENLLAIENSELERNQVATVLGLPIYAPAIRTEEVYKYVDNRWNLINEFIFEERAEWTGVVINGEVALLDNRSYFAEPGSSQQFQIPTVRGAVKGRGVFFDSFKTGDNLDLLKMSDMEIRLNSFKTYADVEGNYSFPSATSGFLTAVTKGRWVDIKNMAGPDYSFFVNANGPTNLLLNSSGNTEFITAQITGYFHITNIHNYMKRIVPTWTGVDRQLRVEVSHQGSCNGVYFPIKVNLLRAGTGYHYGDTHPCYNTVDSTVSYHEYGHFIDDMAGGRTDGGLSEGWADLFVAYVTNQPLSAQRLHFERTVDNFHKYDERGDMYRSEGQAWAAFAWRLRGELIKKYGESKGVEVAENLIIASIVANARDIPRAVLHVIILDDDDNNLSNGTPHLTEIIKAGKPNDLIPFPGRHYAEIKDVIDHQPIFKQGNNALQISGTAQAAVGAFAGYQLFYGQGIYPTQWVPLGPVNNMPVINGTLGTWNYSNLPSGTYSIRLQVYTNFPLVTLHHTFRVHLDPQLFYLKNDFKNSKDVDVQGKYVVWDDGDPELGGYDPDVYLFDLQTLKTINLSAMTNGVGESHAETPSISGNKVVWAEGYNGQYVFVYDIPTQTPTRLTSQRTAKNVFVSGQTVVWQDRRNGDWDIYYYDLTSNTEYRLTTHSSDQINPRISGNRIVWQDKRNGQWDIYSYMLPNGPVVRIDPSVSDQTKPYISNNDLVWEDNRSGKKEVYYKDLSSANSPRKISNVPLDSLDPAISGSRVVWSGMRTKEISDVYYYDLNTNKQLNLTSAYEGRNYRPRIDGSKVVWTTTIGGGIIDNYEKAAVVGTIVP